MRQMTQASLFRSRHAILIRKVDECADMVHAVLSELVKQGKVSEGILREYEADMDVANRATRERAECEGSAGPSTWSDPVEEAVHSK